MQQQYNYVQRINDIVIVPCVFEYGMIVFLSIHAYFFHGCCYEFIRNTQNTIFRMLLRLGWLYQVCTIVLFLY